MGSIRRVVGKDCAAGADKDQAGGPGVSAQTGRRAQTAVATTGVWGNRVCAANGLPVEGATARLRERKCGAQALPRVATRRFFVTIWQAGLAEYDGMDGIGWEWQSIDGAMGKAPLALECVGPNPTDRGKKWTQTKLTCGRTWSPSVLRRQRSQST